MFPAIFLTPFLLNGPAVEHAKITLEVTAPSGSEVAHVDQTPPEAGKNPRPVVHARTGESIRVNYLYENTYPHKTIPNVVVHFYVARVVGGELDLSDPSSLVMETAFDMDFRPGGHAGGRARFAIQEAGRYRVRVEGLRTDSDHEHFAAIDLVIEDD